MMNLSDLLYKTEKVLRDNSPAILTALGVSGTITTAYLTHKASYRMALAIGDEAGVTVKDKVKDFWKLYIPPVVSGTVTVGCIICATRISSKRTAVAYSLLSVSEKAFVEYKDKVVEQIGEKKEQGIRDQIAQDRVANNPTTIISGPGNVLCYEMHTGRYFTCDIEKLKKAQNEVNAKAMRENEASLSDFYYIIGLPYTSYSSSTGWTSDKLMELSFSAVLHEGVPCIAFEYNYVKQL